MQYYIISMIDLKEEIFEEEKEPVVTFYILSVTYPLSPCND